MGQSSAGPRSACVGPRGSDRLPSVDPLRPHLALCLLLSGCGGDYSLTVGAPPGVRVETIEVAVVAASCADVPHELGLDPMVAPLRIVRGRRGMEGEPLGLVRTGAAHLYARGFDASCTVVGSACIDLELSAEGGEIAIELAPIRGPHCGEGCDRIWCTPGDRRCGDGALGRELCDDGNLVAGDGCDPSCRTETGYTCDGTEPSACDPTPIDYEGSTHDHIECITAGGEIRAVQDGAGSEVCVFSAAAGQDAACPPEWSQAAEWSTTQGCSGNNANRWPGERVAVCDVPDAGGASLWCPDQVCVYDVLDYRVGGHPWSNAPTEQLPPDTKTHFAESRRMVRVRWSGRAYQMVAMCSLDVLPGEVQCDDASCYGGLCNGTLVPGYLQVRARRTEIGCR